MAIQNLNCRPSKLSLTDLKNRKDKSETGMMKKYGLQAGLFLGQNGLWNILN